MSDIIDKANHQAQRLLDDALGAMTAPPPNGVIYCLRCDKPIGEQRKAAVPSATRCIKCQTRHEKKGRS